MLLIPSNLPVISELILTHFTSLERKRNEILTGCTPSFFFFFNFFFLCSKKFFFTFLLMWIWHWKFHPLSIGRPQFPSLRFSQPFLAGWSRQNPCSQPFYHEYWHWNLSNLSLKVMTDPRSQVMKSPSPVSWWKESNVNFFYTNRDFFYTKISLIYPFTRFWSNKSSWLLMWG